MKMAMQPLRKSGEKKMPTKKKTKAQPINETIPPGDALGEPTNEPTKTTNQMSNMTFGKTFEEKPISEIAPDPGVKKENRGRPKKQPPAEPLHISPDVFAGIFGILSGVLSKRFGPKWELEQGEISQLSIAAVPLAEKYGAAALQWYPEFVFIGTAAAIIMKRL
jgi:hypothetical protein